MDWGRKWLVDFNAGKTQLVLFDRSKNTGAIDVKMDGSVLEEKTSFKMLGLSFSSKLDWGSYTVSNAKNVIYLDEKSKQNYFAKFFENNLKNLKNTWKGIKSIISMKNSSSNSPTLRTYQNENINNPEIISNIFNNYFSTIGEKTQEKIKHSHKKYTDYLTNENPDMFFLSPTNKEIKFILSSLHVNKSAGPYSIPSKVNYISVKPADLFNLPFTTGTFPTLLKTAKVITIHKKDSKSNFTNYRPISLLSNLDKILEKFMHSRLSTFLNIKDIIYPLQFGFRQNYSTSYALIHLTETIKEALDRGKYGCGIFVDLQKAFDNVDHNILLGKLKHYGIRGVAYSWLESFLKDRKQYVSINGYNSKHLQISLGVPQGSVLGPLFFLIYIDDLNTAIKHCKIHHFVDDTNLLHTNDSIKKLNKAVNSDLKNLTNWLNANKISLNVSKTELILFKPKMKKLDSNLKLKLIGKRLYPTKLVKYLDIKTDENLTWIDHINDMAINKLNRANAMLFKGSL